MRTIFLPTWLDGLPRTAASPRIRCEWPARYLDSAEVYDGSQSLGSFDALVFQKAYLTTEPIEWSKRYRHKIRVADMCDAEFLNLRKLDRLHQHLDRMDACVCPTQALRDWFGQWLPAYVIPDCVDLACHEPATAEQEKYFTDSVGLVWLGGSQNYAALQTLIPVIATLDLPLATISDQPYPNAPFVKWESVEQANEWVKRFDILLNPQPNYGEFRYKSDNKTLTGWALGIPVARDPNELHALLRMTPEQRLVLGQERRKWVERNRSAQVAADMWAALLEDIRAEKEARGEHIGV